MTTVYLAGPITITNWEGANAWRELATETLRGKGLGVRDPLRGKATLQKRLEGKTFEHGWNGDGYKGLAGLEAAITSGHAITRRDMNDVLNSDVLLAFLVETERPSIGTIMEIAWAYLANKYVILVMSEGNPHWHGMVREAASCVVSNLADGIHAAVIYAEGRDDD